MCLSGFRRHQTTSDLMLVGLGSSHWTPLSPPKRGPRVPCIFVTATPPWTIQTTPCCMCSASITSPPAPPLPLPTCQVMCRGTWPAPPPPHAQWTRPRRPKHGRIFGLREQPPEFSWGGGVFTPALVVQDFGCYSEWFSEAPFWSFKCKFLCPEFQ